MSTLTKQTNFLYEPARPGSVGDPGSPATPAYTYTQISTVCVYSPGDYATALALLMDTLSSSGSVQYGSVSYSTGGYACTDVIETIYVPAKPAVPAVVGVTGTDGSFEVNYNLGWTGRAQSNFRLWGDGWYKFRVPATSIGVAVGLSAAPAPSGYGDISHGFLVEKGFTKILENSVEVTDLGYLPAALLEVRREAGDIIYYVDGVEADRTTEVAGPVFLVAALYSGGDQVFDASSGVIAGGAAIPTTGTGAGVLLPLAGFAGKSGSASGAGVLAALVGVAEAMGAPEVAGMSGTLRALSGAASGTSGGVGSGVGGLRALSGYAGVGSGGMGIGKMAPLRSTVYSLASPDEATIASHGRDASSFIEPEVEILLVMNSSAEIGGLIVLEVERSAELLSSASVGDTTSLQSEIQALLSSVVKSSALLADRAAVEPTDTWVYNVEVKGTTRYSEFDFNSFARLGERYYAARADGLYLLGGVDDDGRDVTGEVNFGVLNFGSSARKALPYVYVGMASNGKTVLKVESDGQTFYYEVRDSTEELKEHRFELGRGLRSTFYGVSLIFEGTAFDLRNIEFQPVELNRRL